MVDSEIAWEECIDDIPLDTKNLPPLNALSCTTSSHLPDIDLLDLFSFDSSSCAHGDARSPRAHEVMQQKPRLGTPPPAAMMPESCEGLVFPEMEEETLSPVTSPSPTPSSPGASGCSDGCHSQATHSHSHSHSHSQSSTTKIMLKNSCSTPSPCCHHDAARKNNKTNIIHKAKNLSCSHHVAHPPHQHEEEENKAQNNSGNATELDDQSQLVLELSTRLTSAGAEAAALRKRVASLSAENRSLRAALDHANARLVAVAQAAAMQPATAPAASSSPSPIMLGLAHVTTDVASRIAGALTVSDVNACARPLHGAAGTAAGGVGIGGQGATCMGMGMGAAGGLNGGVCIDDSPRERKKRKRMTGAATTMACVMFMWSAFVGSPGWLSSSSTSPASGDGNLPAVWKGDGPGAVANVPVHPAGLRGVDRAGAWQPNCLRMLEQLPDAPSSAHAEAEAAAATTVVDEDVDEEHRAMSTGNPPVKSTGTGTAGAPAIGKTEPLLTAFRAEDGHVTSSYHLPYASSAAPAVSSSSSSGSGSSGAATSTTASDDGGGCGLRTNKDMFVDVENKAAASVVARADMGVNGGRLPRYSYVLCRDAQMAMDNVKACTTRMKRGETCGEPHTISLIMPAAVAGLDVDGGYDAEGVTADAGANETRRRQVRHAALAEVQCSITAVARIPGDVGRAEGDGRSGRIIATVPETGTVIGDH